MKLYNYLSKKIETLTVGKNNTMNLYVCGPTVYGPMHLGNIRPLICFDIVNRFLQFKNYQVNYIVNITDIDDKIIQSAIVNHCSEQAITKKYTQFFLSYFADFNVLLPNHLPKVTEHMEQMFVYIQKLVNQQMAYVKNNVVYFDVAKVPGYGALSGRNLHAGKNVRNIQNQADKRNAYDFVVWKNTQTGIYWDSPFGKGRPGWHTECALLVSLYCKHEPLNLHGGGIDLIFPHHENEIAQHFALFGYPLSNLWAYNGHLTVNNDKMSKSLNNFVSVEDYKVQYHGAILRFVFLNSSYRKPVSVTPEIFSSTKKLLLKWDHLLKRIFAFDANLFKLGCQADLSNIYCDVKNVTEISNFLDALSFDLNTPNAISLLQAMIKKLNVACRELTGNHLVDAKLFKCVALMLRLLGFKLPIF